MKSSANYKTDCIYFEVIQTKMSDEISPVGKQPDKIIDKHICLKNAFVMNGCPSDCPFYKK